MGDILIPGLTPQILKILRFTIAKILLANAQIRIGVSSTNNTKKAARTTVTLLAINFLLERIKFLVMIISLTLLDV